MKKLTFRELAIKILEEANEPLTTEEIWEFALMNGYDDLVATKGKTPWRTISARIYGEIKDNPENPFIKIDTTPKTFSLKKLHQSNINVDKSKKKILEVKRKVNKEPLYSERDLHPLLSYFAYTYLNVYTTTIYHEKSNKKSFNQWLHPDIVGINFPIEEWESEVLDFGLIYGGQLLNMYSFELKKELNFSNIRESFFQTVSNSSWANESYLVAARILIDDEFMIELKRLTTSFGIGVIKLDVENPDNSEVLFPARPRKDIDWETVNKLSKENPDFSRFIKRIRNDLNTQEIIKEYYDKIHTNEDLIQKLNPFLNKNE